MKHGCPYIFGEVLFDCFPDGAKVLGGAPFNVAWHLQAFGESPLFISRVGMDDEGRAILDAMQTHGMRTDGVQIDASLPTGRVQVSFADGEPEYDIVRPSAWDAIEGGEYGDKCRLIYHGSLALRDERSCSALAQLKAQCRSAPEYAGIFLDVNLRAPWWRQDQLAGLLDAADWVKLNGDELGLLAPSCSASDVLSGSSLTGLILTHGADGAEIMTPANEAIRVRPEQSTQVVDTVGAGDAFASVILLGILRGWPLDITARRAQAFAARMVGVRGATVDDAGFYRDIEAAWENEDGEQPQDGRFMGDV